MKSLFYPGTFSLVAAILAMGNLQAEAADKKVVHTGKATPVGSNGGGATTTGVYRKII